MFTPKPELNLGKFVKNIRDLMVVVEKRRTMKKRSEVIARKLHSVMMLQIPTHN
jgi:hypothetical protein